MSHSSGQLIIHLQALRDNWSLLNAASGRATCSAVVKADAYGLGVHAVAPALFAEGCREFFVATVSEAQTLKGVLSGLEGAKIYVLQGVANEEERALCVQAQFIPVLIRLSMVAAWLQDPEATAAPCAIKINTGMNRLGLDAPELDALVADPQFSQLNLVLCLSHLACADDPLNAFNHSQSDAFNRVKSVLSSVHPQVRYSLANSAGVFLGPDFHFDCVRPGIALYGGQPQLPGRPVSAVCHADKPALQPVVQIRMPVIQIRSIQAGESVGYGQTFVAQRDSVIVTVASGYAEGILRALGNRAEAWFGQRLPMVGRVSMDSCAFDVTDVPVSARPAVGDFVDLIGGECTLDQAASAADTISYEMLTRLGGRLERLYR